MKILLFIVCSDITNKQQFAEFRIFLIYSVRYLFMYFQYNIDIDQFRISSVIKFPFCCHDNIISEQIEIRKEYNRQHRGIEDQNIQFLFFLEMEADVSIIFYAFSKP